MRRVVLSSGAAMPSFSQRNNRLYSGEPFVRRGPPPCETSHQRLLQAADSPFRLFRIDSTRTIRLDNLFVVETGIANRAGSTLNPPCPFC